MKALFVDSSALMAVLLDEARAEIVRDILLCQEPVFASSLLEAEVRSVSARYKVELERVEMTLAPIQWVNPERNLTREIVRVMTTGVYLRGADLWHLACAVYLVGETKGFPFLTLDAPQADAAAKLGFKVLPISKRFSGGTQLEEPDSAYRVAKKPKKVRMGKKVR